MATYKQISVGDRVCVTDIAIQEYGCPEGGLNVVQDNSDRINDIGAVLQPGMILNIETPVPQITDTNQLIAAWFASKNQKVISGTDLPPVTIPIQEGYVEPEEEELYWATEYSTVNLLDAITLVVSNLKILNNQ